MASNPRRKLWRYAKRRAKKKGLPFEISEFDFVIPEVCPILGIPLRPAYKHSEDYSPTLDRVDNSKGYTPGNVLVISQLANQMKSSATKKDLVMFAKWVLDYTLETTNL